VTLHRETHSREEDKTVRRLLIITLALVFAAGMLVDFAHAAPKLQLRAKPFEFVGAAGDCGPDPGVDSVTAAWITGKGLPDAGNSNHALFLQKLGPTPNCAAAGAVIEGIPASGLLLTELGFDIRADGHCGAGAPRFNLYDPNGNFLGFFGCNSGSVVTPNSPQAGWLRVRFPTAVGLTVGFITLIFDEGTDTPAGGFIVTPGTAHVDNIDVNGILIGKPGNAN
jgi:hypothetical protein